jgi:hypothetical protein
MARGNATEEELAAGIRSVGVLSAVTGTEGPRRDNPFAPPSAPKKPAPQERAAPVLSPEPKPAAPSVAVTQKRPIERPPEPSKEVSPAESSPLTDYVTVPMTAEMRSQATELAAQLQRRRTDKSIRFTANTVYQVAIETLLERFELAPDDRVNSKAELRRLVLARLGSPRTKRTSS